MRRTDENQCEVGHHVSTMIRMDLDGNIKETGVPFNEAECHLIAKRNGYLTTFEVMNALRNGQHVYTSFSRWALDT